MLISDISCKPNSSSPMEDLPGLQRDNKLHKYHIKTPMYQINKYSQNGRLNIPIKFSVGRKIVPM